MSSVKKHLQETADLIANAGALAIAAGAGIGVDSGLTDIANGRAFTLQPELV
jgi:NAD-dependent SIR2 family protein deacetylase